MVSNYTIGSMIFSDTSGFVLTGMKGLESIPRKITDFPLIGENFEVFVSALYRKRPFTLSGYIVGSSASDLLTKRDTFFSAMDALKNEATHNITLINGRQLQINACCVDYSAPLQSGMVNACQFEAQFRATFPFLVSQVENSVNVVLQTGGGGKVVPDTMPMALNQDVGGQVGIINNGSGIYYPTVRIYGPVTNPAIRHETLGKELGFAITLASGEYLDVDLKRKTVYDSSGVNRYSTKSGDWWYLIPGTNVIKFLAGTYDANAYVNIKHRDSYLGI